jgi:hypothetical protein
MTTGRIRFTLAALTVALLPAMAAAQTRKVVPVDHGQTAASMGVRGFSVVLVIGGPPGASATDNVPEAARKALADMKDFLPYKRYQLLDTAWILCCGPDNRYRVSGRVRGPDGRDYSYSIDPGDVVGSKLNLRFTMQEMQDSLIAPIKVEKLSDTARLELLRQHTEALRELDEAQLQLRTIRQRYDVGTAAPAEMEAATTRLRRAEQRAQDIHGIESGGQARAGSAQAAVAAQAGAGGRGGGGARGAAGATSSRSIMDSSFSISPGETVVIGTSRLNGDQALIAILTAATKPGGSR